jgi:hypothetical protein
MFGRLRRQSDIDPAAHCLTTGSFTFDGNRLDRYTRCVAG